jgi:hypothetical protein
MAGSNNSLAQSSAVQKEMQYTQNSFCRQNYCVNPIFPGLNDLSRLEKLQWQCATTSLVKDHMDFCKDAVHYDPALPSPKSKATPVNELVKAQEDAAMTMFVYHLNGMGYDSWDYRTPSESDSDCVRSIWKMVCYTYFPRAEAGCKLGQESMFKRPCASSCQNYVQHCGIECCDESVQCVFAHTKTNDKGKLEVLQTGYVDQLGPSAACTGGARRSMSSPLLLLLAIFGLNWAVTAEDGQREASTPDHSRRGRRCGVSRCAILCLAVLVAMLLQGCDVEIPRHKVGNWRKSQNYLSSFEFVPPGKTTADAVLNSCSQTGAAATDQCNGRGYCRAFSKNSIAAQKGTPLTFCQCERDWADPECRTKRKSQIKTFFISIFLGLFGGDYFYLGFPLWGLLKLFTLGGFGFWWLIDIVRTAAGPVYARDFRTAADLPHWVAMIVLVFLALVIGFAVAIVGYLVYRRAKREDIASLSVSEEARHWKNTQEQLDQFEGPRYRAKHYPHGAQPIMGRPGWTGYGATLPLPHPNCDVPCAIPKEALPGYDGRPGPPFAGPFGPSGIAFQGSPTPASTGIAPTHMNLNKFGRIDDNVGDASLPRAN